MHGLILGALIIWKSMMPGDAVIKCTVWHRDWCGMRFSGCSTMSDYECVQNVEVIKIVKPDPPMSIQRDRAMENYDRKFP